MKRFRQLSLVSGAIFLFLLLGAGSTEAFGVGCFPLSGRYVCSVVPEQPAFVKPLPVKDDFILKTTYVRLHDYADVYAEPRRDSPILRNVGDGYLFSSLHGKFRNDAREMWYMINPGEWVLEESIREERQVSDFRGVEVLRHPKRPFGWVVSRNFTPSSEPGGEPDPRFGEMFRYDFVEVYDAVEDGEGWLWYSMGDGRWVKQTHVSLVDWRPRPEEVGAREYWVDVDLYEQTLAAYVGDRMVFATLISSGLNRWPTVEGVFQVFDRFKAIKMSGAEGRVDYYFVEDVPHTMYFDRHNEIALHGAYWHDRFGYKHSHGCVNMPPQDSEWVYQWSEDAPNDLWVKVHTSDPKHYFDKYDSESDLDDT